MPLAITSFLYYLIIPVMWARQTLSIATFNSYNKLKINQQTTKSNLSSQGNKN